MTQIKGFFLKFFCVIVLLNICEVRGQIPTPAELQRISKWFDQVNHAYQSCRKQMNIKEPNFVTYMTQLAYIPENKHDNGCVVACLSTNLGYLSGNNLNIEKILQTVKETMNDGGQMFETVEKIVQKCIKQIANISDRCDLMVAYADCLTTRFIRLNNGRPFQPPAH